MTPMTTTVYTASNSRGFLVEWYLRELGQKVNVKSFDLAKGEQRHSEFLVVNPFGKVPALHESDDGGWTLFESGAILMYLAEKYDPKYPKDIRGRAKVAQWMLFANSTLAEAVSIESLREEQQGQVLQGLEKHLSENEFLLGNDFSVADFVVGGTLAYASMMHEPKLDPSPYPRTAAYKEHAIAHCHRKMVAP
ncbi:hypothetical protein CDCA_CDCA17G4342 [Cyanidium caldarium]|uniref:Glutathione S-transferase n=1 Tax=Cyanidium caldarium TaxID=2771 RepID=A0AAV9J146_CYACA|nr:hypothetical protein CDCA_CDCA17G4342 [Cyanidium caldarium]